VEGFVEGLSKQQGISKGEIEKQFFTSARPSSLLKRFETPEEIAVVVAFVVEHAGRNDERLGGPGRGGVIRSIV